MPERWQLVELHGCWWAYRARCLRRRRFRATDAPPNSRILGPYASRAIAEAMLHRHLSRRDPEGRTRADSSGVLRRVQW
jgi:hypothetical protein